MVWLIVAALVTGGIAGWLAAGRQLPRTIDVRGFWWLPVAFGLYAIALRGRSLTGLELSAALMLAANAVVLYVLWQNRQRLGSWVIACGLTLNLLVIIANGGWMPLSSDVLAQTGHRPGVQVGEVPEGSKGRVMLEEDVRLGILADRIPRPGGGVLSIGDVVMAIGTGYFLWELMAGRPALNLRRFIPSGSRQKGFSQP